MQFGPADCPFLPNDFKCVQTVWLFIKMSDWPILRNTIDIVGVCSNTVRFFQNVPFVTSPIIELKMEIVVHWCDVVHEFSFPCWNQFQFLQFISLRNEYRCVCGSIQLFHSVINIVNSLPADSLILIVDSLVFLFVLFILRII